MFEALVLGIVQGITEFFPISSTAHLVLIPKIFHFSAVTNTLAFDTALHFGTLLALVLVFWKDWIRIIIDNRKLFLLIIIGSIPAGVAGVLFENAVESTLRSPVVIAITLVLLGVILLLSEKFKNGKDVAGLRVTDVLIIGCAQALALIPGVSRSGATIAAGLFLGMKREEAARFSFLLSMPIVAGAALFEGRKLSPGSLSGESGIFLAGIAASALAGYFAIKYLLGFLQKHPVNVFVFYRIALACIILIWWKGLL